MAKQETNIFEKYNFVLSEKPELADYSSAALFTLDKEKRGEREKEITAELEASEAVSSAATENGFLNIRVSEQFLINQINEILSASKKTADDSPIAAKKILIEFISANPTGPLTLGNGRGGFSGDVLAKILRFVGYQIEREFYINDVGNQIEVLAKSLQIQNSKFKIQNQNEKLKIENDEEVYRGEYINELSKKMPTDNVGQWAVNEILENYIKPAIKKMGVEFDSWIKESDFAGAKIKTIIELLKSKNLTYEKDGALWIKTESLGADKDDVLIRSNGEHTYFVADIAYHQDKIERGFDILINFWGADHAGHVKRLEAVIEKVLRPELKWSGKIKFIVFQLVHLFENGKEVRMSKRAGTYVTMDELLDEVGLDATRWFFLNKSFNTHVNFDLKLAKKQNRENPVFYVQYAYARIAGILAKSHARHSDRPKGAEESLSKVRDPSAIARDDIADEERRLILKLAEFPKVINQIAETFELQKLTTYTYEVAEVFHKFYDSCPILTADEETKKWRFDLLISTKKVLKNCFELLGIKAKEKM